MKERKYSFLILPVIIVFVIFFTYFFGWDIGAHLNPEATARNMDELTAIVVKQLDEGRTSGKIYVKNISEEELRNINDYICNVNGTVSQFSIKEKNGSEMKIVLKYDISDNYYVLQKYLYDRAIPDDRPQAIKLYNFITELIPTLIEDGMTDYQKELAIHDYIVEHCEYGYVEHSKEYAYRAYGCLVQNKAVCNGYTEAMSLLLSCVGVENTIITGTAGGELHAWNLVRLDGNWYHVDATWDDPVPNRVNYAAHTFFNVPDYVMDDTHEWKKEMFNECNSMDYNYFEINELFCDYDMAVDTVAYIASRDVTATIQMVLTDYDEAKYGNFSFVCENNGVLYFLVNVESYGDDNIVTLYLNQRE